MCKAIHLIENDIFFRHQIFGVGFGLIHSPCGKLHSLSLHSGFEQSVNGLFQSSLL